MTEAASQLARDLAASRSRRQALGVLGTGTAWPDLAVAAVMAGLAISGGWSVIRHAWQELASTAGAPAAHGH